jgi:MraZ protein
MSIYFKGSETVSMDAKSRVVLPSSYRKQLTPADKSFTVNRGIERCIVCYPDVTWKEQEADLRKLKQYKERERALISIMNEYMYDVDMDAQSRILLSKELIEFAGIKDKVKFVGMIDHMEIWDPDVYAEYKARLNERYSYSSALDEVFNSDVKE